jgi:hypothetical protein
MHLEPRNRNRSTPLATALPSRLTWIRSLFDKKSAGLLAFAAIPPYTRDVDHYVGPRRGEECAVA